MVTRANFPIGTDVEFSESGQPATVVSIEKSDEKEYESATDIFVLMNGQVIRTNVERLNPA